jgi:glucose/arabinose dehydrogenase
VFRLFAVIALGGILLPLGTAVADPKFLTAPSGFVLETYAEGVSDARQIAIGPPGLVFVGSREAGKVYALVDADLDHRVERIFVIAERLFMPSGLAYRKGALYVAEVNRILRFDDIANHYRAPPAPTVIYDRLPQEAHHGWKYLGFGPDDRLYVPVGAPCNVCLKDDPYASILRMNADGGEVEVYARGIRNSVGFRWHPTTGELWFTDNGRDWMGDDSPSCELNRITAPGQHFGFPYVHGGDELDPKFGGTHSPNDFIPPVVKLGPHVAPLGFIFYRGKMFPTEYQGNLLIAEHGSWNRSDPIGYRIQRVVLDADGQVLEHVPFITGWLDGGDVHGRPTDLAELPDGSVLIADDTANAVYRLTYVAPK